MQKKTDGFFDRIKKYLDYFHRDVEIEIESFAKSLKKGAKVLDAGAGEGKYREFFSHCNVIGLDNCVGDERWDYSSLDIVGDIHNLPFKDETFDAVISVVVFEHLKNPFKAMEEISRVLKKGGKVFVVFPFIWEMHQKPNDFFRFTEFGFREIANNVSLNVEEIKPLGCFFRVIHYEIASLIKSALHNFFSFIIVLFFFPYLILFMLLSDIVDRLVRICNYTPGYKTILKK